MPPLPAPLTTILLTGTALAAGLLLWLGLAVYVYWDTGQRNLSSSRRWGWRAAACIPILGWLAYMLAGRSSHPPPQPAEAAVPRGARRHTILKPLPVGRRRVPTLDAAQLAGGTQPHRAGSDTPGRGGISRYVVRVLEGPHSGQEFQLLRLPAQIGRLPEAEVNLGRDLGISRQQAEFYEQSGELRVRDLGSAHGTRVNGQRVTDQIVRANDKIMVGYSVLTVTRETDPI